MNPVAGGTAPVETHPADRFIIPAPDLAPAPTENEPTAAAENPNGTRGEPSTEDLAEAPPDDVRRALRAERIGLLSVSLGAAGLGGAWQSATATVSAPVGVSDGLFAVSGLIWLVLLAEYVRHGGAHWANLKHDLGHPGQGFALAYIPIVGMLFAAHFSRFGLQTARWAYAVFAVAAAVIAARLLAHWLTGALSASPLHPGYLLPVSSGPFIASVTAASLRLPEVAEGAFAVGLLYWLAFGTVVLGSLVANPSLPARARPTLTVLGIPPATGGLAWTAAHPGPVDAVGYGFAGLVAFTLLIIVCLLPDLRQQSFHVGFWTFSFPIAATANFAIRWVHGADVPAWRPLTWIVLSAASLALAALALATVVHVLRGRPRPSGAHRA
jgi:tellurite resistance protein